MAYTWTHDIMTDDEITAALLEGSLSVFNDDVCEQLREGALSSATLKEVRMTGVVTINGFQDCNNLEIAIFPNCQKIVKRSLADGKAFKRGYFPSLTWVETSAFDTPYQNIDVLVIGTALTTVCTASGYPFRNSKVNIYVPDALVEDYKTATNWSRYASKIKGISELPAEYQEEYQEVMSYVEN